MVNSNNPINNTVGASISGVTNTLTVTNPSNTASSAAREKITVGGASAADPTLNWNVNGATDWEMGIDNSVNDNLTISQSAALGTKDVWRMNTSGQRTMPLQPCFLARVSADIPNVTGDGTLYTVIFDSVVFDQASNYNNATGLFTAPVTGKYIFQATVEIGNVQVGNTDYEGNLILSGGGYRFWIFDPGPIRSFDTPSGLYFVSQTGSMIIDMTAGDTASFQIGVTNGAKTILVASGTGGLSHFSGALLV